MQANALRLVDLKLPFGRKNAFHKIPFRTKRQTNAVSDHYCVEL